MGCLWSWKALAFFRTRDSVTARRVFLFSLLYLPLLLTAMMLDRRPILTDDVDSLNNVPVLLELRAVE